MQVKLTIKVSLGEAVSWIVEKLNNFRWGETILVWKILIVSIVFVKLKRVYISDQVTVRLICTDQLCDLNRFTSRSLGRGRVHLAHSGNRAAFKKCYDLIKLRLSSIFAKGGRCDEFTIFWSEVGLPWSVNRWRVLAPLLVHGINIIGISSWHEIVSRECVLAHWHETGGASERAVALRDFATGDIFEQIAWSSRKHI